MSEVRPPWKYENPLCAEVGVEIFFTDDKDEQTDRQKYNVYEDARKVCSLCSHLSECSQWAIRNEKFGFWGGLNPVERKEIRGKLNIILGEELHIAS